VRDLVSDGVADSTLRDAETELSRVLRPLEYEGQDARGNEAQQIRAAVADADIDAAKIARTRQLIRDLRPEADRRIQAYLDAETPGWRSDLAGLDDDEIPLRDPETPGEDDISAWARDAGYTTEEWVGAAGVGAAVAAILNAVVDDGEERERAAPAAGRALAAAGAAGGEGAATAREPAAGLRPSRRRSLSRLTGSRPGGCRRRGSRRRRSRSRVRRGGSSRGGFR
jgi:DNA excision repair protein ERCC-2